MYNVAFIKIFEVKYTSMSRVRFNYANVKPVTLSHKRLIKDFVATIFLNEGRILKVINYIFCNDDYLLQINQSFLNHDT